MEEAQEALQVIINNSQDETAALNNPKLIQAIGRGIGSTAAHEIAHQFLVECCSMDVKISADPNAAGTYNNGDADADPNPQVVDSDPSPYTGYWKDGKTPIKWESTTQAALTRQAALHVIKIEQVGSRRSMRSNISAGFACLPVEGSKSDIRHRQT